VQGSMYGTHISHSGARPDPGSKGGLAVLRISGISARTTPNFGLWTVDCGKRSWSGCCTRRLCDTFSTLSGGCLRDPDPTQ
jgi:hypothetical protein